MDIISHALWSAALFKSINLKLKKKKEKFNLWWAAFWGMFPDIFAFVIPGIILFPIILSQTGFNLASAISTAQASPYSDIIAILYSISHSLVIFALVFLLIWFIFKKPVWLMFGWLLHILIDIPTHTAGHFTTPILWPVSNFSINGLIYWGESLFMIIDIALLIIVWTIIFAVERKKKKS